ncbi:glucosamine-6-phosphate deaminase [Lactococcus garvieae]
MGFDLLKEAMDNGAKTLGLATGSTPVEFYNQIVKSDLDFSDMTSVNLDEYVGLDGSDEQSYRYFMSKHLFNEKPFKENFLPNGKAADLEAETKAYDQIIAEHPIDFQILGIGQNGHIGFNEPGTSFEETTHVVDLQESTIKANARFFENEEDVPRQAISMGIASIMAAKSIVLMAYGESKAEAIKGMVEGEITEDMPASILQKHADVVVIADEAAAALLSK